MSEMRELHAQIILEHADKPHNRGEIPDADLEEYLLNPLCGDEVTVYATFEDGQVKDARFTGRGCSISQASASMMTGRLAGKTREEAADEVARFKAMMTGEVEFPEYDELAALKGVIQYPSRIRCATLAWTAFQKGLE